MEKCVDIMCSPTCGGKALNLLIYKSLMQLCRLAQCRGCHPAETLESGWMSLSPFLYCKEGEGPQHMAQGSAARGTCKVIKTRTRGRSDSSQVGLSAWRLFAKTDTGCRSGLADQ